MSHPYIVFEDSRLWEAIDTAISELEQNQDVQVATAREYVVGYLCQELSRQKLVTEESVSGE